MNRTFGLGGPSQAQDHKQSWMTLKSGFKKRAGDSVGVVGQQLRLNAMDPRRLLQGLDHVSQQTNLYLAGVR